MLRPQGLLLLDGIAPARVVLRYVQYFLCIDELLFNFWHRFIVESLTERALQIGKLQNGNSGVFIAFFDAVLNSR